MSEKDQTPPQIGPVQGSDTRPLWSVMIPAFNCADYLGQTLRSVLAQAQSPEQMQIEVVDDCSTKDDPETVVRAVGNGRVAFHCKPQNEGATCNFNTCIQRARGELVHILHGDDYVLPGFYEAVEEAFRRCPETAMVITRSLIVDEKGELETISGRVQHWENTPVRTVGSQAYQNDIRTPAVVVRRSFYEQHGGYLPSLIHTADWEMWLRACHFGGALSINQPLAAYRMFAANHTGRLMRTGDNLRDFLRLAHQVSGYLGEQFESQRFKRMVAVGAFRQGLDYRRSGDEQASKANFALFKEVAAFPLRIYLRVRDLAANW